MPDLTPEDLAEGRRLLGCGAVLEKRLDWSEKHLRALLDAAERADKAEEALRSLACYVSAGGYNADTVDASRFEQKIRSGIDAVVRVQVDRAEKAEAELRDANERRAETVAMCDQLQAECTRLREERDRIIGTARYGCGCQAVRSDKIKAFCPVHVKGLAERELFKCPDCRCAAGCCCCSEGDCGCKEEPELPCK